MLADGRWPLADIKELFKNYFTAFVSHGLTQMNVSDKKKSLNS